jgi:acidic leucine-rich nuclear phosphoprotein 32 family protein B
LRLKGDLVIIVAKFLMDEIWERAVETALEGQTDNLAVRALTLDGAVKCIQGRLPAAPSLFEKFENLQHLSIASIGVSTLEQFPRLGNLEKLILSDNRISGGLEFLVEAGLDSLRDLDLSNNRIQYIEDLAPLAKLRLVSLDLYECPVTRVKDYRARVFGLISSLKYLDKMDAEENERPESDDEEEEEEEEEEDPGSGEVDGEGGRPLGMNNGHSEVGEGIVDVDEEEESEADEEEAETGRDGNGVRQNGFRVEVVDRREEEGGEGEEGDEFGEEEIDEDDDDVVEVHEIGDDSDEDDDAVEYEEEEDDDDDDNEDDDEEDEEGEEEEVDNDEGDLGEPESTGRLTSTEGEIDGHEHGEDDGEEDDNGETGEEEQVVEDDGEFDDEEDGEEEVRCSGILCLPYLFICFICVAW